MRDLRQTAFDFIHAENRYILLSEKESVKGRGLALPYRALSREDRKYFVMVFSDLNIAKEYVDVCGYDRIDGQYPLAELPSDNSDLAVYLFSLVYNAIGTVAIVDAVDGGGVYIDTMRLTQLLDVPLTMGMISPTVKYLPAID